MQDVMATVTGNVGTDVELTRGGGWTRANFRMATTPRIMRQGQWMDGETTWISVTCWGRTAEHVKASVAKGDALIVQGRLRTSAWLRDGVRQEQLVLEAAVIGHDLTRGTTTFTRAANRVQTPEGEVDAETGELSTTAVTSDGLDDPEFTQHLAENGLQAPAETRERELVGAGVAG